VHFPLPKLALRELNATELAPYPASSTPGRHASRSPRAKEASLAGIVHRGGWLRRARGAAPARVGWRSERERGRRRGAEADRALPASAVGPRRPRGPAARSRTISAGARRIRREAAVAARGESEGGGGARRLSAVPQASTDALTRRAVAPLPPACWCAVAKNEFGA
jgi:hypothetical protein